MYTRLSTGWLVEVFLFFSLSIVSNLLRFAIRNMALLAALVLTARKQLFALLARYGEAFSIVNVVSVLNFVVT